MRSADQLRAAARRLDARNLPWQEWEKDALRDLYPLMTNRELARLFSRTTAAVKKMALTDLRCRNKLPHVVERAYHQAQEDTRATQFTAGNRPQTWQPVGTIVRDADGYQKQKISDRRDRPSRFNWKYVHVMEWEKYHGPVPAGHNVVFRNGNKDDIRIDNLELVSDAELMRRNTYHRYGPEIARAIQLKGALSRKINRRMKQREEQNRRSA
jgi:hypothetical protein